MKSNATIARILKQPAGGYAIYLYTILAGLISAIWFWGVANHGLDGHHQGFMARPAVDIFSGRTLYAESWSFYQPLPQYLNALSLLIFGDRITSLQYMTVIGYSLCGMGVALLSHRVAGYRAALLSVAVFLASSPEVVQFVSAKLSSQPIWAVELVMLPWPSVWALAFGLFSMVVGIKIVDAEQAKVSDFVLMGVLIGLTAASRLFSGVFLLAAFIAVVLFLRRQTKLPHLLLLIFISFITLLTFYLPSLMVMSLKELWSMQIGEASSFAIKGNGLGAVVLTYLSYFTDPIKIGSTLFVAVLLIAAGYTKTLRTFSLTTFNTLVCAFVINVVFAVLIHRESVWVQFSSVYSKHALWTIALAFLTGFSIWHSRQMGAPKKWRILAVAGSIAVALMLFKIIGYQNLSYKVISELQVVWPGILLALSALTIFMLIYTVVADGRAFADNIDKGVLAAIALGIPALSQLFPVCEARHIFWSCIPLATVAVSLAVRPLLSSRVGQFNTFVLAMMLIVPFSTTAIGYYERQATPRVKINSGTFLDGMMITPEFNSWLTPLLESIQHYENIHPNTPIIFLGHHNAFGLAAQNKAVPNRYALKQFNYGDPQEVIPFQQFISAYKPILWLEGSFAAQSNDRKLLPDSYCIIATMPLNKNINPFDSVILAPCHLDTESPLALRK